MALPSLLRSTVFRRTLGLVTAMAIVAAAIIALVGWRANAILTASTSAAIDAELAELRAEFRARGLEGLTAAVAERAKLRGPGLYRLEDETGRLRAGNLAAMPSVLGRGIRSGTFAYTPQIGAPRTGAGVLIDIDNHAFLLVGRDIEGQRALLHAIFRSVGLGALLLAGLGILGGVLLSRHVLSRIAAMETASATIMAGNLSSRLPLDGSGDELDRLAGRLNEMLARIEQLMAGLREVSDNIAHDLRTPLNRLRNRAEAALADTRAGPAWRDGLERVIDEADDLIKTFNALLLIARLEAQSAADGLEVVDAAAMAADLAELYEPVAEEAAFTLRFERSAEPLPVRANRQLLGQALTNLIENVLKYGRPVAEAGAASPAPATLDVIARREGADAVLVVADRGMGIAPADRERALRRFVRLETSRSLPGTGLGLSLVAAVARLHRGAVRLEDNAPGLRVSLVLPLATPPAPCHPPAATQERRPSRDDGRA